MYSTTTDLFLFNQAYKSGNLSNSTGPLYNEGLFGKLPGYNAAVWGVDDIFIAVLSNNYSTPMRRIALDLARMMLGKAYSTIQVDKNSVFTSWPFGEYAGDYRVGNEVLTIATFATALIEYDQGGRWRGYRLIPMEQDTFFDTAYLENMVFLRDNTGRISGFQRAGGENATRIK